MTTQAFKDNDICITQAFQKIDNSNGKIFRVKFEYKSTNKDPKKKGKVRSMLARTKVRKNLKGVGSKYNPEDKGLRRVYDMALARKNKDENCYRHINTNIEYLKIKGVAYNVYKCINLAKFHTKGVWCPMCNGNTFSHNFINQ